MKSLLRWSGRIASSCAALARFPSRIEQAALAEIQKVGLESGSLRKRCQSSGRAKKCTNGLTQPLRHQNHQDGFFGVPNKDITFRPALYFFSYGREAGRPNQFHTFLKGNIKWSSVRHISAAFSRAQFRVRWYGSEGVEWPITQSLSPQSPVAKAA